MDCCNHESSLNRSRGTPNGASVEPLRISSQHLVVELFCSLGLFGELLKIKDVLAPTRGGEEVDQQLVDAFTLVVMHPVRRVGQALDAVEVGYVIVVGLG